MNNYDGITKDELTQRILTTMQTINATIENNDEYINSNYCTSEQEQILISQNEMLKGLKRKLRGE